MIIPSLVELEIVRTIRDQRPSGSWPFEIVLAVVDPTAMVAVPPGFNLDLRKSSGV